MTDAGHKRRGQRRKTHERFVEEAAVRNPKVEVIGRYEGAQRHIKVRCRECGHVWEPIANNILQGTGCSKCHHRGLSASCRKTHEQYVAEVAERNPNVEVIGRYEGSQRRIRVRCRECGREWEPVANTILQGTGCPGCVTRRPRKTHERFVEEVASKNPSIEVIGRYETAAKPIRVRCRTCGYVWEPTAANVLHGSGCPKCAYRKVSDARRKTHEQYVAEVAERNPNVEVIGRYEGSSKPVWTRCRTCGHVWEPRAQSLLTGGSCPKCSGHGRRTHEQFMEEVAARNPSVEVLGHYEGSSKPIKARCRKCGNVWHPRAGNVLHGSGCPKCARKRFSASRRKTHEQFVEEVAARNPSVEVLGHYEGSSKPVWTRCRECGHVWKPRAQSLLTGGSCPKCSGHERKTHEQFVDEVASKNPKVEILGHYEGSSKPVRARCRDCGYVWSPLASNIRLGSGCPKCHRRKLSASHRKTQEQFLADLATKNPNVEVLGHYEGSAKRVKVRCRRCGHIWTPTANGIMQGSGCPECARKRVSASHRKTHEQFVSDLAAKNPNVEVLGRYEGSAKRIRVRCRKCGHVWDAWPGNLLKGSGCPYCRALQRLQITSAQGADVGVQSISQDAAATFDIYADHGGDGRRLD